MGLLDFLKPSQGRLSGEERREYREHLAELDVLLEQGLEELGTEIAAMTEAGELDAMSIWTKSARLSAIEEEISLVERGITERLTREELAELARNQVESQASRQ